MKPAHHCSSFSHDNTLLIISAVDIWEQCSLAGMTVTWARDRITDICPECLEMQLLDTSGPPPGQKDEANTDVPKLHVANFQLEAGSKSQLFTTDSHFKRTHSRAEINMFTACWCKKKSNGKEMVWSPLLIRLFTTTKSAHRLYKKKDVWAFWVRKPKPCFLTASRGRPG